MTMPTTLRNLAAVAGVAALMAGTIGVPVVQAQSTQQPSPQQAPGEFSNGDLKSFAEASLQIESLNRKWQPQIAGANDQQEQATLRDQAMREMTAAVQETGLSVGEYNQIANAMQIDPETAATIREYRAELQ